MQSTRTRRATTWALLGAFLGTLPGAPAAIAAPEGERVVKGKATFERDGSNTKITTKTRETIVDYDRFGIGEGESVRIDQPNKRSRILNRVPHGEESRIDGALSSNGIVYILNPAGVFIGDRAVVDVNGLVAGAAALSNKDFMKGVDRFTDVKGDVGVAAGAQVRATRDVVLVGRNVENLGSISSERGMVALVAGDGVLLTRHGGHVMVRVDGPGEAPPGTDFALTQGGQVEGQYVTLAAGDAYSLAMNHTGVTRAGEIHVQSEGDGLVQVAGTLDASNAAPGEKGGSIRVDGGRIAVQDAVLDASGAAGGGEIEVGGDVRGGGNGPTARRVFVGEDAELRADATASGNGGKIVVYADEQTSFYGKLSARGGAQGGDGGFAEISGASLVARGDVDLGAPQGEAGTLLYDPDKIVIIGGSPVTGDGSDLPDTSPDLLSSQSRLGQVLSGDTGALVGDAFEIYESEIEGTDANIVLEATNRIEVSGNFNNDSPDAPEDEPSYEGDGFVVIMPGRSLTLRTTGTTVPTGVVADSELGIDLTTDGNDALAWRVSNGGNITLATNLAKREFDNDDDLPTTPKASITVGKLESNSAKFQSFDNIHVQLPQDRNIQITAVRGDIHVNEIDAHGEDAKALPDDGDAKTPDLGSSTGGAQIQITTQQGDVHINGPIQGWGGSGTPTNNSPGANGSEITIGTEGGNVFIDGDIDVHGGDGIGAFTFDNPADPANPNKVTGGGAGGAIGIAAHGSNIHQGELTVSSDMNARGGDGRPFNDTKGTDDDPTDDEVIAAQGGVGGAVALSGTKTITVGTTANPVLFDASGGDGSTNGGSARNNFELTDLPGPTFAQAFRFTGLVDGSTLNNTTGPVEIHGQLIARGGNARQFADDPANGNIPLADIPGGAGGSGGDVLALPKTLAASEMLLDLRGGNGNLPTKGTTDPPLDTDGNPIELGGTGGDVAVTASGRVELGGRTTGVVDANGDLPCCGIISRGGNAENGLGGGGGFVTITTGDPSDTGGLAGDVDIVAGDIDVSGGNASPSNGATKVPLAGGQGGSVTLISRERDAGSVLLRGRLGGEGGIGDDGKTADPLHAEGAVVSLNASKAIQVAGDINADQVVVAGSNVSLTGDALTVGTDTKPVPIAGTGRSGDEGADTATVRTGGTIAIEIRNENQLPIGADTDAAPDALENLNLELTQSTATTLVQRGGATIVSGAGTGSEHTITSMKTAEGDPAVTYRLDVLAGEDDPQPALAIARGAVELGPAGGQIINGGIPDPEDPTKIANNRGRIIGTGDGTAPHVTSAGTVRLQGSTIGDDATPIGVAGAGADDEAILRLDADGEIDAAVVPVEASDFHAIEIVQFDADADADVSMRGDDGIHIQKAAEQDNKPISRITSAVTTTSQTGFSYRLEALPQDDSVDEAVVQVDRMDLGGNGLVVTRGDIVLRDDTVATPIVTNGNALTLATIAGGIRQESTGDAATPSIDMIGSSDLTADENRELVLVANDDIGTTTTPLRMRGVAKIAGQAETGDFVIVNQDDNGKGLRIMRLAPRDPALLEVPDNVQNYFGIGAGSPTELNSIDITNRGSPGEDRIILGDLTEGLEFVLPHLRAGDDVRLHADAIEIENARFFEINQPAVGQVFLRFNDARVVAGDDVVFEGVDGAPGGAVRTSTDAIATIPPPEEGEEPVANPPPDEFVHGKLLVQAGGTVTYGGDVGGDGSNTDHELMRLDTTSATVGGTSAETRSFRVGQAQFRGTLDGPAAVNIVASDPDGLTNSVHDATVTFDGNLGGQQRLGGLNVEAEKIQFTSANNVSATGAISLDTNQTTVPAAATISDTTGGLSIQTDGAFTLAENEKLSVQGPLGIRANSVTVGDVNAASQLSIDSPEIHIRAREDALILLKDGSTVEDHGTDLVADRVHLSSVPIFDDPNGVQLEGARIGVGGGGISAPKGTFETFHVVYATPDVQHVTTSDMQGPNGQVLDLEALGRAVVSDPASDIPRERPLTDPSLAPRYSKEGPAPAPAVDAEQLLAYLRCGDAGGPEAGCDAADAEQLGAVRDWSDSALATPRAEQIAQSYREMRSRDLSAAFDAAGSGFREAQGFGEFDPAAFARYLEQSSEHPEARAAIHRLANVLVEIDLLGLPPEDATRIRNELAGELAAEADLPGFDADAVLLAVDATPIELPQ